MSWSARVLPAFIRACALLTACGWGTNLAAQEHLHTPGVSGMPQGVPFFCAPVTTTSVATGPWSSPNTWSTKKVPGANDKVAVNTGHTVTYGVASDIKIDCIEVRGKLAFKTDAKTHLKVVTIMVPQDGALEIGSAAAPIAHDVTAEIVIADQPFNPEIDPAQIGNGIVALGKVTMHGAVKAHDLPQTQPGTSGGSNETGARAAGYRLESWETVW